jgi:hypothetical protein
VNAAVSISLTLSSLYLFQPAKLYKLKHLTKVEVISNDPSGCTFVLVPTLTPLLHCFMEYLESQFLNPLLTLLY